VTDDDRTQKAEGAAAGEKPPEVQPPETASAAELSDWVVGARSLLRVSDVPKPTPVSVLLRRRRRYGLAICFLTLAAVGLAVYSTAKELRSATELHGRIVDLEGRPIVGARVFLTFQPKIEATTGQDGVFRLAEVPLGLQDLLVVVEDAGEEYLVRAARGDVTDIGNLVNHVPPQSVRKGPGGGADWGSDTSIR
jgi:hypothetical protein